MHCYEVFVLKVFISNTAKVVRVSRRVPQTCMKLEAAFRCVICRDASLYPVPNLTDAFLPPCPCSCAGTENSRKRHSQSFCCVRREPRCPLNVGKNDKHPALPCTPRLVLYRPLCASYQDLALFSDTEWWKALSSWCCTVTDEQRCTVKPQFTVTRDEGAAQRFRMCVAAWAPMVRSRPLRLGRSRRPFL